MGVGRVDGVRRAALAEACQREMIVQRQRPLGIVEALDVLVGLRVVLAPVHVLQHVHIFGYRFEPAVRVDQIVKKVHVPDIVRGPGLVPYGHRLRDHRVHQLLPRSGLDGHDHLVNVQQRYVFV